MWRNDIIHVIFTGTLLSFLCFQGPKKSAKSDIVRTWKCLELSRRLSWPPWPLTRGKEVARGQWTFSFFHFYFKRQLRKLRHLSWHLKSQNFLRNEWADQDIRGCGHAEREFDCVFTTLVEEIFAKYYCSQKLTSFVLYLFTKHAWYFFCHG